VVVEGGILGGACMQNPKNRLGVRILFLTVMTFVLLLSGCETFLEAFLMALEDEMYVSYGLVGTWTGSMTETGLFSDSRTPIRVIVERRSSNSFSGFFERYVDGRWLTHAIQNSKITADGNLSFSWGYSNQHFFTGKLSSGRISGTWRDSSFFTREGTWTVSKAY